MTLKITDIKSDRDNILRFVTTIFKNPFIIKFTKTDNKFNEYQKITNQYKNQLRKLLNVIRSNNDYRINEINIQLNELITYFNGATDVIKVTTSKIVINDIIKVLIQFLEIKYSDLLKINII